MRQLNTPKEISIQYDFDWYSKVTYKDWSFSYFILDKEGQFVEWPVAKHDWYITVAVEKMEEIKVNREKLLANLVIEFRDAIRENYQKQLRCSYSKVKTIEQIESYIKRVWDTYNKWK